MECFRFVYRIVEGFSFSQDWWCESGSKKCLRFLGFPQRLGMSNSKDYGSGSSLKDKPLLGI